MLEVMASETLVEIGKVVAEDLTVKFEGKV